MRYIRTEAHGWALLTFMNASARIGEENSQMFIV